MSNRSAALRHSAKQEAELLADVLAFRDDPVGFVHYAYPWGQAGTPFEKLSGPRQWQLEELERLAAHARSAAAARALEQPQDMYRAAFSSGRGPGKSALFGMIAHWHASTHIGAPCIVTANTETQLRTKTFPEFGRWFTSAINSHWFVPEGMRIVIAPWLASLVERPVPEGGLGVDTKYWTVSGQTWTEDNADAFAGAHNPFGMLVLFDEASGIPSPIWDVTEGFFSDDSPYRFWLAASQMRKNKGRFFELFSDARMGRGWHCRTISTRGMAGVDQKKLALDIERYGEDSDYVRVEIDGLPPRTSEDQLIEWGAVRAAQTNELQPDADAPLILGVDPAPRGRTAFRFRQGRNARDCVGTLTHFELHGSDNVDIANKIIELDRRYQIDAICIDFGMGTGVIDVLKRTRLRCRHVHEINFGTSKLPVGESIWELMGGYLWGVMRDWLPSAMIERDDGGKETLSYELTNREWRWSGKNEAKRRLETKTEMQARGAASPDKADALALTFAVDPPRRDRSRIRYPRGQRVEIAEGVDAGYDF